MLKRKKSAARALIWLLTLLLVLSLAACETERDPTPLPPAEQADCSHRDKNDDGLCDRCALDVVVEFDLFAINDLHGKLLDSASQPGVDELTAYLKNEYAKNENTILFSSGDMWQGSAESGLTRGGMMTEWMNELDFAFMTLGNHEFDWGEEAIRQNAALAEFPFLAINIYDRDTDALADFCQASVTVDLGQVQVGFIGAIGDCYSSISGDMSEDFYFLTGASLTALVQKESRRLRDAGVDFIVYSLHDGTEGCDAGLTRGGYVDIVFEGHTHASYVHADDVAVYHLQGGGENSGISHAEVRYNFANGRQSIYAQVIKSSRYGTGQADDAVELLMEKYAEEVALLESPLGVNDSRRDGNELRQLVAEQYASLAAARWQDYPVVLGGGYLSCRSPGRLDVGEVSYGDLYMLFPFDNRLALCSCKGSDLLKNYVHSQNKNYFVAYTEYGQAVKNEIDPEGRYYLITDSYNYTYAPNNLTVVEYYDAGVYARDLMAQLIAEGALGAADAFEGELSTIPQLIETARSLAPGSESEELYGVRGTVTQVSNTKYGNLYIEDAEGNRFYIYGVYQNGIRYDGLAEKPLVGDTVTLYGKLMHYVNGDGESVYEMKDAELVGKSE